MNEDFEYLNENLRGIDIFFRDWINTYKKNDKEEIAPLHSRLLSFFEKYPPTPLVENANPRETSWATSIDEFKRFIKDLNSAIDNNTETIRLGSAINVWKASRLKRDELRNSNVLAWLLDWRGSHGQGFEILATLLNHLAPSFMAINNFPAKNDCDSSYWLRIESCPLGERESRVDIEIDGDKFLLFIEVKIDAQETNNQLQRYLDIGKIKARGRPWGVIFLTRNGRVPQRYEQSNIIGATWADISVVIKTHMKTLPVDSFSRMALLQFVNHIKSFK